MDKTIIKITKIGLLALGAIALLFTVLMNIDAILVVAYITLGIALFIALLFPVIHMVSNPKGASKAFLGVAVIVVLGLISYLFASNDYSAIKKEKMHITESASVWVGAGLNLTFIVGIITALAAIFLAIKGSISK
jgi:hypothetical protein